MSEDTTTHSELPDDLHTLKVNQLKQELTKRGECELHNQRKAILVARLQVYVDQEKQQQQPNHSITVDILKSFKVVELKQQLKLRDLPIGGVKHVLQERLASSLGLNLSSQENGEEAEAEESHQDANDASEFIGKDSNKEYTTNESEPEVNTEVVEINIETYGDCNTGHRDSDSKLAAQENYVDVKIDANEQTPPESSVARNAIKDGLTHASHSTITSTVEDEDKENQCNQIEGQQNDILFKKIDEDGSVGEAHPNKLIEASTNIEEDKLQVGVSKEKDESGAKTLILDTNFTSQKKEASASHGIYAQNEVECLTTKSCFEQNDCVGGESDIDEDKVLATSLGSTSEEQQSMDDMNKTTSMKVEGSQYPIDNRTKEGFSSQENVLHSETSNFSENHIGGIKKNEVGDTGLAVSDDDKLTTQNEMKEAENDDFVQGMVENPHFESVENVIGITCSYDEIVLDKDSSNALKDQDGEIDTKVNQSTSYLEGSSGNLDDNEILDEKNVDNVVEVIAVSEVDEQNCNDQEVDVPSTLLRDGDIPGLPSLSVNQETSVERISHEEETLEEMFSFVEKSLLEASAHVDIEPSPETKSSDDDSVGRELEHLDISQMELHRELESATLSLSPICPKKDQVAFVDHAIEKREQLDVAMNGNPSFSFDRVKENAIIEDENNLQGSKFITQNKTDEKMKENETIMEPSSTIKENAIIEEQNNLQGLNFISQSKTDKKMKGSETTMEPSLTIKDKTRLHIVPQQTFRTKIPPVGFKTNVTQTDYSKASATKSTVLGRKTQLPRMNSESQKSLFKIQSSIPKPNATQVVAPKAKSSAKMNRKNKTKLTKIPSSRPKSNMAQNSAPNVKPVPKIKRTHTKSYKTAHSTVDAKPNDENVSPQNQATSKCGGSHLADVRSQRSLYVNGKIKHWKFLKPDNGDSEVKIVNRRVYYWCRKCSLWNASHGTKQHLKGFDGATEKNKGVNDGIICDQVDRQN